MTLADEDNPLLFGGSFTEDCVTNLGVGGDLWFLGGGTGDEAFVGLYWQEDDGESASFDFWADMYYDAPTEPGTYPVPDDMSNIYELGLSLEVYNAGPYYVPVPSSGEFVLTDYAIDDPVDQVFSGYAVMQLQEVSVDEETGDATPVEGGCSGDFWVSWWGVAMEDN